MPELTNTQAIIDTAQEAANPSQLDTDGRFYTVTVPQGAHLEVIDLEKHLDLYRDTPRRATGTSTLTEVDCYLAFIAKHGLPETELWASIDAATVTAVINANQGNGDGPDAPSSPGWGDHCAILKLRHTDDWTAWVSRDRKWQSQTQFAEHVEDHLPNFVTPAGSTMVELAQSFQANTKVRFESSKRISSGQTQLVYKEDVEAKAGQKGDITIPETFTLGLIPYESGDAYGVTARLRYRINDGELNLSYALDRPRDVLREAFTGVIDAIETGSGRKVWHGAP